MNFLLKSICFQKLSELHHILSGKFLITAFVFSSLLSHSQDLEQIGKSKAIKFSGTLNIQGGPYIYLGKGEPRNDPFWWIATGSPMISIYGWQLPFSFSVGSRNRSFSQPFNRFGVSPYYKWATFHFGYRSIRFNPYIMSGLQFLGAGVELNPKGLRFAAFYGRFAKAIREDTNASITPIPAYKRTGMGVKLGVGNRRSYFDLMLFHAADDTNSIQTPVSNQYAEITPQENLAVGISSRIAFLKRMNFQFDLAGSMLNRDARQEVLEDIDKVNPIRSFFAPKIGFQFLTAGQASLNLNFKHAGLRIHYRRVDPDYRSLGAFYQQSDLQALTFDPSFRLFKNKLRLSGSIGKQQDNLYKRKAFTSVRNIGSAGIVFAPNRTYTGDFTFSNFGIAQQAGLQVLNDSFRVAQVNRTFSTGHQINLSNKQRNLNLNFNISYQELKDLNPFSTGSSENQVWYSNFQVTRIRVRDNMSLNGGVNFSRNQFANGIFLLAGPMAGFSKSLMKEKFVMSSNLSYNFGFQSGKSSGGTINWYSSLQYRLSKTHLFSLNLNVLQNSTPYFSSGNFAEIRLLGGYILSLQSK